MNKQLIAAMTSIAMIASSCVSTQKSEFRGIASELQAEKVAEIAKQGIEGAKGGKVDFGSAPFFVRNFESKDVQELAAAYDMKLSAGQIITDNDMAFNQKLKVIHDAQHELRMVYFIYSDDYSSSKLNSALLDKAKQGVDITLMVDFITNYKNLDLFIALNEASNHKIKVNFYNFPSQTIFQDANYMTLPCPGGKPSSHDDCYKDKVAKMKDMGITSQPTPFAKLLLTGIYGKSAAALKAALGLGAQINPADYKGKVTSEEDMEALKDLAEIVEEAFIKGSIIAKIKLSMAISMYGDKINPILNEVTGRLPVRRLSEDSRHADVWDHLTDYTHHKLVIADKNQFVLGGRNVEDSYHMKKVIGTKGKYIFMDTDFWGQTKEDDGAKGIVDAFDKIIQSNMVASLDTVKTHLAYDFIANTGGKNEIGAAQRAVGFCMQQNSSDMGGCILDSLPKMEGFISQANRVKNVIDQMGQSYKAYQTKYQATPAANPFFGKLSSKDLEQAQFSYIENVNYNKKNGERIAGSKVGFEKENNKNIQATWYRALENVCKVSADQKIEKRVVFHTAYLLMPSGLIHRLAQMMNNDFGDCSRVTVTFITNSPFTTDLAPVNILARYQLGALFDHYATLNKIKSDFEQPAMVSSNDSGAGGRMMKFKYKSFWPKLEYYEYAPADVPSLVALNGAKPNSLHTKTTLIGDDLIVGSANADIRSYMMDTNNALLIRNATDMNASYLAFINNLVKTGKIVDHLSEFQGKSFDELRTANQQFLYAGAQRWKQERRLTPELVKSVLDKIDQAGKMVYNTTRSLLIYRGEFEKARLDSETRPQAGKFNDELNKAANNMDNWFKVF